MASYLGIEFAEGLKMPFAEFKKMFITTHIFKELPPEKREVELLKAYKVACPNGKLPPVKEESKSSKASKGKE